MTDYTKRALAVLEHVARGWMPAGAVETLTAAIELMRAAALPNNSNPGQNNPGQNNPGRFAAENAFWDNDGDGSFRRRIDWLVEQRLYARAEMNTVVQHLKGVATDANAELSAAQAEIERVRAAAPKDAKAERKHCERTLVDVLGELGLDLDDVPEPRVNAAVRVLGVSHAAARAEGAAELATCKGEVERLSQTVASWERDYDRTNALKWGGP